MNFNKLIQQEKNKEYFQNLVTFLAKEYENKIIYPPKSDIMNAFKLTHFQQVKVVIIGQDPYHQPNQAMGLSFSVKQGVQLPKSLINIFTELEDDLGIHNTSGDLTPWAKQGVFLLNTTLTVEQGKPMSHANQGWEQFTTTVIHELCQQKQDLVFLLWGKHAQQFEPVAKQYGHYVLKSVHPSPLSAYRGFFGSKPFSTCNKYLISKNKQPIDWRTYNV